MPKMPDGLILCGGAGLRLRGVIGDSAKGMASIAGRPFLELLLRQLHRHGFEKVILAVGYQKDSIRKHFGDRAYELDLMYSEETVPLGTGGALRNAAQLIASDSVLVMNGDSYADVDLTAFAESYRDVGCDASMVVITPDGRSDCGFVLLRPDGEVKSFNEKEAPHDEAYVNAGIYLVSKSMLQEIPRGREISLEKTTFPHWLHEGRHIRAFIHSGRCIDIGTPERYHNAQGALAGFETDMCIQGEGQR